MAARVAILALCVTVARCLQPAARIYIETSRPNRPKADLSALDSLNQDIEKRYTKELLEDLKHTKTDALLLYTEFTAQAADDLQLFMSNISALARDTISNIPIGIMDRVPKKCRDDFENDIKKIVYDSHRVASFSGENHHKYFLGHMIVFKMHLNRSENYISKCERIMTGCGIHCETTPKMIRWRRLALHELNRVKDDIQHSRRSYKDLLVHSRRKLKRLRIEAQLLANKAIEKVKLCRCKNTC